MFGSSCLEFVIGEALELVVEVEEQGFHSKAEEDAACAVALLYILPLVEDPFLLLVVDDVGDIVGADLVQVSEDVGEFPGAVFLLEDFPAPRNG